MGHPFSAILSQGPISPLILSDQLISLAQAAEGAGLRNTANRLVDLACSVLDEPGDTHDVAKSRYARSRRDLLTGTRCGRQSSWQAIRAGASGPEP